MCQAPDHDGLIRQHLIPHGPWKLPDRGAAAAERLRHDMMLKRILADADERAADLFDDGIGDAGHGGKRWER